MPLSATCIHNFRKGPRLRGKIFGQKGSNSSCCFLAAIAFSELVYPGTSAPKSTRPTVSGDQANHETGHRHSENAVTTSPATIRTSLRHAPFPTGAHTLAGCRGVTAIKHRVMGKAVSRQDRA
jgi:hypothetical protein